MKTNLSLYLVMPLIVPMVLVLALIGIVMADWLVVSDVQNTVLATCDTKVAYDKSGDMYCMDIPGRSERVTQK